MPSGQRREHAQHVTSLKIYFRLRLKAVPNCLPTVPRDNSKSQSEEVKTGESQSEGRKHPKGYINTAMAYAPKLLGLS